MPTEALFCYFSNHHTFFFSCLIAVARFSRTMLNVNGDSRQRFTVIRLMLSLMDSCSDQFFSEQVKKMLFIGLLKAMFFQWSCMDVRVRL